MSGTLHAILLAAIPAILAITLHEAAHGYAALALGDRTAQLAGRLSLNPLRHIDPFGTIILPALLVLSHVGFVFGWAKPVPVSARAFADPRRGMMVVAAAGPGMNFLLAWIGALALWAVPYVPPTWGPDAVQALNYFILFNLILALFNLIPIPPLDGGRIAVGLLPQKLAFAWASLERYGLLIVLLLVVVLPAGLARMGYGFDPVNAALNNILPPVVHAILGLAGHNV